MEYTFRPLTHNIFWLAFKDRYDLAMHFLRAQEYHESPNPDFKGQRFNVWDYIEWYSKNCGNGAFTYPIDWSAFNVPREVLSGLYYGAMSGLNYLPGINKYDKFMAALFGFMDTQCDHNDFYLIGTLVGDVESAKHEMAHAMWALDEEYRNMQQENLKKIPLKAYNILEGNVMNMGYDITAAKDEMHAYLSTGHVDEFIEGMDEYDIDELSFIFRKTFEDFSDDSIYL